MELDIADEAPLASTSSGPIKQQEHDGATQPAASPSRSTTSTSKGPLLFPFEAEGLAASHITGTSDLITTLGLANAYYSSVKPYLNLRLPGDIKGKGRAVDEDAVPIASAATKHEEGVGSAKEKGKAMKKHYNHMIADVPGQNKLAKDHVLRDLLLNPEPPDHINISLLDDTALREAFTLEVGMLPDFDTSIWRADADEQARKRRKKRKQEEASALHAGANGAPSPAAMVPGSGGIAITFNNNKKRKTD